jgi:hypothetical protein
MYKQRSYKITIMKMFAPLDKAKPLTENTRGSNLGAVKHTTNWILLGSDDGV